MSASRRQLHRPRSRRRRSSSARRCGSPDELLPDYYRLVMESDDDPLAGDPMEAKLALARFIVARSHGEEAAAGRRGALHARRARRAGARGGAGGRAARRRPRAPAGAARRRRSGWLDERGKAADRAGRGAAGRRGRHRARRPAGSARRRARPGRKAPIRALDTPPEALLPFSGCLPGGCTKVPANSTRRALEQQRIRAVPTSGASGASRRLFYAVSGVARSLKTQQRALTSRPELVREFRLNLSAPRLRPRGTLSFKLT